MQTYSLKAAQIDRQWHLLNAEGEVLGRLASRAARLLAGKHKPTYTPHLDGGDFVVVINAAKIKTTGKKLEQKQYYRHSGYPGGFRQTVMSEQMTKDPTKVIYHAVAGMLPPNKLKDRRLVRLKVFADKKHPYQNQLNPVSAGQNADVKS